MENDETLFVAALIFSVVVLIFVKIIDYFVRFNNDTRLIIRAMRRAYDYDEYRCWRRELRCHYLCLIPFVNERNVMRLYRRIYHKPKHEKAENRSDGLYHVLAPSVIGIFICAVCLCGVSFAWFTSSQTSNVANIRAATYTVSVTADNTEIPETDGIIEISLDAGDEYTLTLTAGGNAKSGYCKAEFEGTEYYTPQITPNNIFNFKVKANSDGVLKITSQWGTCTATDNIIVSETTLELGTMSANGNNEPENNALAATPQVIPATPENTKPTVDSDSETTAPTEADEQTNNNDISERDQETETDLENE